MMYRDHDDENHDDGDDDDEDDKDDVHNNYVDMMYHDAGMTG